MPDVVTAEQVSEALARRRGGGGQVTPEQVSELLAARQRRTPAAPLDAMPDEEEAFQTWYGERAGALGLDPNPDDPRHHYDYRAAYRAGAEPNVEGHWPSQFKAPDHPNRYVGGVDTITGQPGPVAQTAERHALNGEVGGSTPPGPVDELEAFVQQYPDAPVVQQLARLRGMPRTPPAGSRGGADELDYGPAITQAEEAVRQAMLERQQPGGVFHEASEATPGARFASGLGAPMRRGMPRIAEALGLDDLGPPPTGVAGTLGSMAGGIIGGPAELGSMAIPAAASFKIGQAVGRFLTPALGKAGAGAVAAAVSGAGGAYPWGVVARLGQAGERLRTDPVGAVLDALIPGPETLAGAVVGVPFGVAGALGRGGGRAGARGSPGLPGAAASTPGAGPGGAVAREAAGGVGPPGAGGTPREPGMAGAGGRAETASPKLAILTQDGQLYSSETAATHAQVADQHGLRVQEVMDSGYEVDGKFYESPGEAIAAMRPKEAGDVVQANATEGVPVREEGTVGDQAGEVAPAGAVAQGSAVRPQGKVIPPSKAGGPDWVLDKIDELALPAERSGVADTIEELAAQRFTRKEIAKRLSVDVDVVNAVRARRGIPSMDMASEFDAWLAQRPRAATEAAATAKPLARMTNPELVAELNSYGLQVQKGVSRHGMIKLVGEHRAKGTPAAAPKPRPPHAMSNADLLAELKAGGINVQKGLPRQSIIAQVKKRRAPAPAPEAPKPAAPPAPKPIAKMSNDELAAGIKAAKGAAPAEGAPLPPPPKGAPETKAPPPRTGGGITSARAAMNAADRRDYGLEELASPDRRSWEEALDAADEQGIRGKADDLAAAVVATPRPLTDVETAGMVARTADLKKEYKAKLRAVGEAKDAAAVAWRVAEAAEIERKYETLTRAMKESGTEKGRALASQKLTINDDFSLLSLQDQAKAKKGSGLNRKQARAVQRASDKIEAVSQRAAEVEAKAAEQTAERALRRNRRQKRGTPEATLTAEFKKTLLEIRDLIKKGCL